VKGKKRMFNNRKYCFECSPWGKHNTKQLHVDGPNLPRGNYLAVRKYRYKRKIKCVEYLGGKCSRCGYDKSLRALVFHHRDPEEKEYGMTQLQNKSWVKAKVELDKCDLLCSNCHAEVHEELEGLEEKNLYRSEHALSSI
jgi:hypothetical protein